MTNPNTTEVAGFPATEEDLLVLAEHWFEKGRSEELFAHFCGNAWGGMFDEMHFAYGRVGAIGEFLDEDVLEERLRPLREKWEKEFKDVEADLQKLRKCQKCGHEFRVEVFCAAWCPECDHPVRLGEKDS